MTIKLTVSITKYQVFLNNIQSLISNPSIFYPRLLRKTIIILYNREKRNNFPRSFHVTPPSGFYDKYKIPRSRGWSATQLAPDTSEEVFFPCTVSKLVSIHFYDSRFRRISHRCRYKKRYRHHMFPRVWRENANSAMASAAIRSGRL